MNRKSALPSLFLVGLFAVLTLNCSSGKEPSSFAGTYTGPATNKANSTDKKALSMTITSSDNPVAGTYTFIGGTINAVGKISGSVLGSILNLSLKPDAIGTTYTFSGSANDNNTILTGTMTGVESATAVTYTVVVNK